MKKAILCAALSLLLLLPTGCSRRAKDEGTRGGKTAEEILAAMNPVQPELIVDGVAYTRKKDVSTLLFMGIDKEGDLETSRTDIGGQSDVLLLVVNDGDDGVQTILQIDRDTMVEVEILGHSGDPTGVTRTQQICLSHTYGNGDEKSCENTVRAVSRLLGGIQVDGYVALLFDAVPALNDAVGGVEVTITDDFSATDPSLEMGKTMTLMGDQALHYVRGRMRIGDGTNRSRMGRQRSYLSTLGAKVRAMMKENSSVINDLYQAAEPYMITDMTYGELSSFALAGAEYRNGGILTPEGETTTEQYPNGNTYVEFHADGDSILDQILKLFYSPVG